jgi:hypothetical protein
VVNVVTKLVTPYRWSVSVGCQPLCHIETAVFGRTGIIFCVVMSSCTVQIVVKISVFQIQNHGRKTSHWLVQWCPIKVSILNQMNSVDTPLSKVLK